MRTVIQYRGFKIVALFREGKYQGRAHGEQMFAAEGADLDSVLENLKCEVDLWVTEKEKVLAREREARHKKFLEDLGIPYRGVRPSSGIKERRVTHCYDCKGHLDNRIDTECVACGWILCDCGACGCGWKSRSS